MRFVPILFVIALFAGCLADGPDPVTDDEPTGPILPDDNTPFNGTLSRFGDAWTHELPRNGQGIWIHNHTLYWTNGQDLVIVDITDPEVPVTLGNITEIGARDVDILEWDGRLYALLAGSNRGMHVVDVTDPVDPIHVSTLEMPSAGVHNVAAVPGTPYAYSSGASGQEKRIDIIDITDPADPAFHTFVIPATVGNVPVESDGCHDITVRADLARAYCAGGGGKYLGAGGETFIWDISDPLQPVWLSMIDDPRIKYHHQAFPNDDGTILILNDEYVGPLLVPGVGANNCFHYDLEPLPAHQEPQIPIAAAWIYDISDETAPVQLSFIQNDAGWDGDGAPSNPAEGNCGSHFGDIIHGQEAFIMGWYQGGTVLVDFSTPDDPQLLDVAIADGSHWDSMYWQGNVYHSGADLVITPLV